MATTESFLPLALQVCATMRCVVLLLRATERGNFPTDLYMLEGLIRHLDAGHKLRLVNSPEEIMEAIDSDVAVAVLTHVSYRTGRMLDMAAITAHAHSRCQPSEVN